LAESNFGAYASLLLSDPGLLFKYWHSLGWSLLESFPVSDAWLVIITVAFLMLCARWVSTARQQWSVLINAIRKQEYGNR